MDQTAEGQATQSSPAGEESPMPFRPVQFVHLQTPQQARQQSPAASSRATINAHATRANHARRRHAQTLAYRAARHGTARHGGTASREQLQGARQQLQLTSPDGDQALITQSMAGPFAAGMAAFRISPTTGPTTTGVGGPARSDPFTAFARAFTPVEHFLFDHCQ